MVILPISKYSECQFQVLNIYPSLARASSSDLTRSSFLLQPGPAHVLFYLRKPPQLSRYVSLSAPCVSRISISVISHTEVISSTTFIQVTAAEGEASEEQSRELQLHQALLQCTGQAREKMLGQELDRDGRTMAPGSGPADSLT